MKQFSPILTLPIIVAEGKTKVLEAISGVFPSNSYKTILFIPRIIIICWLGLSNNIPYIYTYYHKAFSDVVMKPFPPSRGSSSPLIG
jgi:hypothetical protein